AAPGATDVKPYTGVQFAAIPEFQEIGSEVGQLMSAALAGSMSIEDALAEAQAAAEAIMGN
ncbi:MAG: sugar ABC transporter substrate-binding protein, partial [Alphaproteobacteria bacterium]